MEFWDDYDHENGSIEYVVESVKSEEIQSSSDEQLEGCYCSGLCSNVCPCTSRSGSFYEFTDINNLNTYRLKTTQIKPKPTYECNDWCECKDRLCGNKLVQYGPNKNLKITNENSKGLGLTVSPQLIQANSFVCEYAGEVITQIEATKRFQLGRKQNYIFCINETFGGSNYKTYIDPTHRGNIGRYINHSCDANCILIPIRINDIIPKLCIFAKYDLEVGTEITFNYGTPTDSVVSSGIQRELTKCLCASKNCKKFLPYDVTI